MRREREVNEEKVDANKEKRQTSGSNGIMGCKPLPIQHFTNPTQPRHFYPIRTQARTRPLHPPNPQPKWKPLPAKAKPPPRVKKGVIAHPDEDDDDEGRRRKPRKAMMSLMGVSPDGDNDGQHGEKRRRGGGRGP